MHLTNKRDAALIYKYILYSKSAKFLHYVLQT